MKFIRIPLPSTDTFYIENKLSANAPRGSNRLRVIKSKKVPSGGIYLLGRPGELETEAINPVGFENDNLILKKEIVQSHLQSTGIYHTLVSRIELYDENGTLVKNVEIDWTKPATIIPLDNMESREKPEYEFSYVSGTKSNVKTEKRPAFFGDSLGYTLNDSMVTFDELEREFKKREFGDEATNAIEKSEVALFINYALQDIANDFVIPNDTQYFQVLRDYQILAGKSQYQLPPDFDELLEVRIDGCRIDEMPLAMREQTCGRCSEKKECEVHYDECGCLVECPEEDHLDCNDCYFPINYFYTVENHTMRILPTPRRDAIMTLLYSAFPETIEEGTRGIFIPKGFRNLLMTRALYLYKINYKKDAESIAHAQVLFQNYRDISRKLEEKMQRRAIGFRKVRKQVVRGARAEGFSRKPTQFGPTGRLHF